ncbi:MAG: HEAT repeat domain-containing protein, partial [Myxococcales bacterium]|nr:HEAT repeat domain-containing protein [Myxococcales bacterium]
STGDASDRAAAARMLPQLDDPRAEDAQLRLLRDPDDQVAQAAIDAAYDGGGAVVGALGRIVQDDTVSAQRRRAAAFQLRNLGAALDAATTGAVEALVGPVDGGAGTAPYLYESFGPWDG